jgi:DNA-binding transcriptional LysR family regulator
VVRTTSQTAAAEALKISQGSVRHMFSQAIKRLEETEPTAPELELLKLVERSYNQLRAISSQQRWIWKKSAGGGDVPNPDDE